MMRKFVLTVLALVFCFALSATANGFNNSNRTVVNASDSTASDNVSAQVEDITVTMRDIEAFLKDKKEHYPLSDEFIERYQQSSGGYIDTARKAGLTVDKQKHEPNQKWHFFDSWLYPSIDDGSLTWDADAQSRVYNKLLCPELLLWIYEASGVNPTKVKAAKEVAEQGKTAKTNVSTIAKNMRACVPWEDIANAVKGFEPVPSVTVNPSKVTLTVGERATITAKLFNSEDLATAASWSVTEGDGLIEITANGNEVTVSAVAKGVAKVKVSYGENLNAECVVTVKEQSVIDPAIEGAFKYDIKYDLGTRKTAKQINTVEELLDALQLVGEGNGIISSVSEMNYIYGGGNGGRSETAWYSGDMLKIGTTSVNGSVTFELNAEVSRIVITGYVSDNACKIKVGDSADDGKNTTVTCSDMNEASKDIVENGQTTAIVIDFDGTTSITIETTNKKPLYITSIEFVVAGAEQ